MSANPEDPMYAEALEYVRKYARGPFTPQAFQRWMRVGFIKRDELLHRLEDDGEVRRSSRGRFEASDGTPTTPDSDPRSRPRTA